jgi:hypothetical protein
MHFPAMRRPSVGTMSCQPYRCLPRGAARRAVRRISRPCGRGSRCRRPTRTSAAQCSSSRSRAATVKGARLAASPWWDSVQLAWGRRTP